VSASLLHLPKLEVSDALKEIHRVLEHKGMLVLTVQESIGETWDYGYSESTKRFFARNERHEIEAVLSYNGFYVQKTGVSRLKACTWLKLVCVAVKQ